MIILSNHNFLWCINLGVQVPGVLSMVCCFGSIITGYILIRMGNLVQEFDAPKEDKKDATVVAFEPPVKGDRVKLHCFTLLHQPRFNSWLKRMPPRSILLLTKWLQFDYLFMAFFYPFLFFLLIYFTNLYEQPGVNFILSSNLLALTALFAGLMDALENFFALRAINAVDPDRGRHVNLMRLFSYLKWIGVFLSVIAVLAVCLVYFL